MVGLCEGGNEPPGSLKASNCGPDKTGVGTPAGDGNTAQCTGRKGAVQLDEGHVFGPARPSSSEQPAVERNVDSFEELFRLDFFEEHQPCWSTESLSY
ncbi:hypothetical protein ANN_21231 [Periplaneta americana]|uniref:Uncharacterized protein n=1 Tax=Periplaneta americana TaxID=6978 RepID=A0ABQ8SF74_PERAM|nr:hypothetical protein ANN_21231 [Periplaneta americana]